MSLTCQYVQLNYSYPLSQPARELQLEAKLLIPDQLPKIDTIIGGTLQISTPVVNIHDGHLKISGVVYPHLLYQAEKPREESSSQRSQWFEHENEENSNDSLVVAEPMEYSHLWSDDHGVAFEEQIEIPGVTEDSLLTVQIIPKTSNFEKLNPNQINFKTKLELHPPADPKTANYHHERPVIGAIGKSHRN